MLLVLLRLQVFCMIPHTIVTCFGLKLEDMKSWDETSSRIFEQLPDIFTYRELKASINVLYHGQ
jgi:hypothetical protein